jgi:arsenate reductase (thioredoxin)
MWKKPKVLFFSTGSAVRSQMAEGLLRRISGEELEGECAAVRPVSNPLAIEVMQEIGIDVSHDKPKEIKELFKEHFTCVITLSDPAKERDPVWPFTRNLLHWRLPDPDPVEAKGSPEQQREAFRHVRDKIADNVRQFASSVAPELHAKKAAGG